MRRLVKRLKRFTDDERGLELPEYAVMLALIVAVIIFAIYTLRTAIAGRFNAVADIISGVS